MTTKRKPDQQELRKIRSKIKHKAAEEALKRFCTKNGESIAVLVYCNPEGDGGIATFGTCEDCRLTAESISNRIMHALEFSQENHP